MDTETRQKLALGILVAFLLVSTIHLAWYYPKLPDRIATHFGAAGRPDGWSSKKSFAVIYVFAQIFVAALFLGIPAVISRTPLSLLNLPHKDYWMAPERRERTHRIFRSFFYGFGAVTALFLLMTMHSVIEVNLGDREQLGPLFYWTLIAYLVFAVARSLQFIWRLWRKVDPQEAILE